MEERRHDCADCRDLLIELKTEIKGDNGLNKKLDEFIAASNKRIYSIEKRVDRIEGHIDTFKGALWLIGFIGVGNLVLLLKTMFKL